jgi:hypothetical protein
MKEINAMAGSNRVPLGAPVNPLRLHENQDGASRTPLCLAAASHNHDLIWLVQLPRKRMFEAGLCRLMLTTTEEFKARECRRR